MGRRYALAAVVVALAGIGAACVPTPAPNTGRAIAPPAMSFSPPSKDFGVVTEARTQRFILTSESEIPHQFNVRASGINVVLVGNTCNNRVLHYGQKCEVTVQVLPGFVGSGNYTAAIVAGQGSARLTWQIP